MTTTWTLKAPDKLDTLVREATRELGYTSKGELIREAVRDFLLERNIFRRLGNLDTTKDASESPLESLVKLRKLDLSDEELADILTKGRDQLEELLREASDIA